EECEAGQSKGCRKTSHERLLLYPALRCHPRADRNTKNKPSSPADPSRVGWHTWIFAQLKHGIRHQKKADPVKNPQNCSRSQSQGRSIGFELCLCHYSTLLGCLPPNNGSWPFFVCANAAAADWCPRAGSDNDPSLTDVHHSCPPEH